MAPVPEEKIGAESKAGVFFYDVDDEHPFDDADIHDEDIEQEDEEDHDYLTEEVPLLPSDQGRSRFGWLFNWGRSEEPQKTITDEHEKRTEFAGEAPSAVGEAARNGFTLGPSVAQRHIMKTDGTFEKRSPFWVEGWRRRQYVIRGKKLLYFNPNSPDRPLGVIDFGLINYEIHAFRGSDAKEQPDTDKLKVNCCDPCQAAIPSDYRQFFLKPSAFPKKVFAFRGPGNDVEDLINLLQEFVQDSKELDATDVQEEKSIVSLKNFWRYPFIREATFRDQVESGDILLFRGKDRAAKIQRLATGALYDHVALLLRTPSGVVLLEATGRLGVNLLDWEHFMDMRWHKIYDWMAYRKVYFSRTEEQTLALEGFIRSVLGNPYSLTVAKLINRTLSETFDGSGGLMASDEPKDEFQSCNSLPAAVEQLPPRSFFCSELTAACLKRCGVISGAKASTSYWPGTFSQRSSESIELHEGVYIGEEQLLVFDN